MNWSEAVARLDFEVYGVVEPEPNGRAPGNYGSDGSSAMIDIGVRHDIDGSIVDVETLSTRSRIPADHRLRLRIGRLLPALVESDTGPVTLPLELTGEVTAFDRPILVDGISIVFTCVRLDGVDSWGGEATLANGSIVSIAAADEVSGLALGTVDKLDLLDLGH